MLISPAGRYFPVVADELAPLSIERLDNAEFPPPARCARHRDDFAQRVLSTVLVETPLVSPIPAPVLSVRQCLPAQRGRLTVCRAMSV